ncbi:MAG: tRNA pseudouridine(38-40) synthase TruA [Acidobacteria bacterium]|nr:tRNA pseudouridine(38-40) synthase TruA [Acidobacteriota bacterium]
MTRSPRRYRATVAYVGTWFNGFQFQQNAERTVQAVLEDAIRRFADEGPVRVHAAGRTDAGVHAEGQVIHFDLPAARDPLRIREGVNALLPWDVRVLDAAPAPEGFLARRDAVWREYRYRWSRAAVIPPKDALFVAAISAGAEAAPMRAAAASLRGRKDFSVFAVKGPGGRGAERRIHFADVEEAGDEIQVLIRGDAFLRGMVRSICGVLAHVARGKAPRDRIAQLLETGDRALLAPKAPARGLTLTRVHYGDDVSREPTGSETPGVLRDQRDR